MDTSRVIVGQDRGVSSGRGDPEAALNVLGGFGLLFLVASAIDILLALLPANLSLADVRFTALGATAGALPLTALGLLAFEISALGLGSRGASRIAVGLDLLATVLILLALTQFVLSYEPTKAAASTELAELVNTTLRRGVASYLFFGAAFALGGIVGWRSLRRWSS